MISEEEEEDDDEEKVDFSAVKHEERMFTLTSTTGDSQDIGQGGNGLRGNEVNASKLEDFNEDSDDDSNGFPIRQTFDSRPIIWFQAEKNVLDGFIYKILHYKCNSQLNKLEKFLS